MATRSPAMATNPGGDLYHVVGQIGEGAFGLVHYARGPQNRVCAIKTFKTSPEDPPVVPAPTIREVYLLRELKHENVLNLVHVQVNHVELTVSLVFDYAEYDLNRIVRHHRDAKRGAPIPSPMVKSIAWQTLRGVEYLHEKHVLHRDLKPENILIMGDGVERGLIKIADFGLARKIDRVPRPLDENGPVVTLWYRAPELLLGAKDYSSAVDVWAVGAIFGELLTLAPVFRGVEEPGSARKRDMYDRSQLEKIFQVLGVPAGKRKRKNNEDEDEDAETTDANPLRDVSDDVVWPSCESHPFWRRAFEAGLFETKKIGFPNSCADHEASDILSLIRALCRYDPEKRLSARNASTHPYFRAHPRPSRNALHRGDQPPENYPQRRIKKDEDEKRARREREAGEVAAAPRGAAGAAALNAVRS